MTNTTAGKPLLSVGTMTRIAILAAAASILFLLEIPIVAFYKLDLSNIPVMLGAFSMGTVPGLIILGLKSLIGLLHSSSAGVGELADFIMGAALLIPARSAPRWSASWSTSLSCCLSTWARSTWIWTQSSHSRTWAVWTLNGSCCC